MRPHRSQTYSHPLSNNTHTLADSEISTPLRPFLQTHRRSSAGCDKTAERASSGGSFRGVAEANVTRGHPFARVAVCMPPLEFPSPDVVPHIKTGLIRARGSSDARHPCPRVVRTLDVQKGLGSNVLHPGGLLESPSRKKHGIDYVLRPDYIAIRNIYLYFV